MNPMRIKAHFDGEHVQLDEPVQLPLNARLIVTVIDTLAPDESTDWSSFSTANLARCYGEDEPDYTVEDIIP